MHPAAQQPADRAGRWPAALLPVLAATLTAERDRWICWLPILTGAGIVAYFALASEPPGWPAPLLAALASAAALGLRDRPGLRLGAIALAMSALGFAAAQWQTVRADAPMLDRETGPGLVVGRVTAVEMLPDAGARRVLLEDLSIEDVPPDATPPRVRVRLRGAEPPVRAGDLVELLAILDGPSEPVAPGAFDFRRQAFFDGLGGIGFALRPAVILDRREPSGIAEGLDEVRARMAGRIVATLGPGDRSAVAVALMTGERAAISDEANAAMRDSGLAHILSISGMHVSMVAAGVFLVLRGGLALIPPLALRWPIKKWAAAATLVVIVAYGFFVGMTVPTERAVLMTGLVMLAIMADRKALSMRSIALAALAVLAVAPHSLLGPSMQMSFAAVACLIVLYEGPWNTIRLRLAERGLTGRLLVYLLAIAVTSLVASLATAPFAAYHFQRLSLAGLAANLLAMPVTGLGIMLPGMLSYLLAPLGWDGPAHVVVGWGVGALLWIARTAAAWPWAALSVPAMPAAALVAIVLGGTWICIWRRGWRWFGLAGIGAGLALTAAAPRPDMLIEAEGRLVAIRDGAGDFWFSTARGAAFERGIWLRLTGQAEPLYWPPVGIGLDGSLACDGRGCLWQSGAGRVAITGDRAAAAEDCDIADLIVATVPVARGCRAPLSIDRFDVWRWGAHAVFFEEAGPRVVTVGEQVGDRPWTRHGDRRWAE